MSLLGKIKAKIKGQGGETLVELLASILIGTLSIALLFGSVSAAGRVDLAAKQLDAEYYAGLSAAEMQQTEVALSATPQVVITNPTNGMVKRLDIAVYGEKGMYSYALKENP